MKVTNAMLQLGDTVTVSRAVFSTDRWTRGRSLEEVGNPVENC